MTATTGETARIKRWKAVTVALMFAGYAGYYLCRSDLSVTLPLILDDLASHGISPSDARIRMGAIISFGVLAYAAGKFLLAGIADFIGGKKNFLGGMAGAILFTFLFALGGGLPIFSLAWIGNRFVQAAGWGGMVKVTSKWFSYSSYGTVMGVLSLSFLFGDALARQFMGALIRAGLGWRGVFLAAGGTLCVLWILNALFLKESGSAAGAGDPEPNPANLYAGEAGSEPGGVLALLRPMLSSPLFWMVCGISLGATLVRETFNTWTPTYLNQSIGYSKADAASLSSFFPFFGGVSVLIAGYLSDRLGPSGRALVMTIGMLITAAGLIALGLAGSRSAAPLAVGLVSMVAFGLLGPYSYLGGAMALDFGGRKGGAAVSGFIDGVGYLGGVLAGDSIARLSVAYGWTAVFEILGAVAFLSAMAAFVLERMQRRRA